MSKLYPFKKEHLDLMDIRPHEKAVLENFTDLSVLEGPFSFTGVHEGVVLSVGGISNITPDCMSLWQIPSVYVDKHVLVYGRKITEWIDEVAKKTSAKRMETVTLNDDLHIRWMEFLKFEKEGIKRKMLNGMDYIMWGRLWV